MHEPLNPRQQQVEETLRKMAPAPVALKRDELMFAAGRASAKSGVRVRAWQGACACLAVLCAGALLMRPGPVTERTIVVHDSAAPPVAATVETQPLPMDLSVSHSREWDSSGANYLELRNLVLARGVGVLRPAPGTGSSGEDSHPPALEGVEGVPAWQLRGTLLQGGHS